MCDTERGVSSSSVNVKCMCLHNSVARIKIHLGRYTGITHDLKRLHLFSAEIPSDNIHTL